jgi:hypothetical protein
MVVDAKQVGTVRRPLYGILIRRATARDPGNGLGRHFGSIRCRGREYRVIYAGERQEPHVWEQTHAEEIVPAHQPAVTVFAA